MGSFLKEIIFWASTIGTKGFRRVNNMDVLAMKPAGLPWESGCLRP
jgi:hypothetical protein